ncbi:MAG: imidazoleglycerol-phosphate dehydratase HisB [Ruminococcaceae bacterium]|nr:imidazoleglycerol-phosphate dehydratase HisB [Oscillospiraceae bacterium]
MREYSVNRKTNETDIKLTLNLDGTGKSVVDTGCGFLDHMLTLFASHGRFDLNVTCKGDTYVDDHHTVEDVGIALGQAFESALGDKRGITRYGNIILPMDEALILCAVDISGRDVLSFKAQIPAAKVGTFDTELTKEFFLAFVRNCRMSLHIQQLDGENSHHIIEGMFKAFGRVMRGAVSIDPKFSQEVPSTKGVL